jgi:hypothetical protein
MASNDKPSTQRGVPPGVPNLPHAPDLGQPNAFETAAAEVARRQAQDRVQSGAEERFVSRDASFEESRGGHERAFNNDDWERAAARTDPERRRAIRAVFEDTLLPNLPKTPGLHRCWVSTTHPNDTPQRRLRLGYSFVTYESVRKEGWAADEYAVKDSSNIYAGCIMWREMIAMETPEENFVAIMRELHHDAPMEQARGIYEALAGASEEVTDRGGRVAMSPDFESLRTFTRPPRQFES